MDGRRLMTRPKELAEVIDRTPMIRSVGVLGRMLNVELFGENRDIS